MSSTSQEHSDWTAAGSDATAQKTYVSVRSALAALESRWDIDIFLQGSYANKTNIRADSDVDIVVRSRKSFRSNKHILSTGARQAFDATYGPASYHINDLRDEVIGALNAYYGSAIVEPRNKCIRVKRRDGYLDADVVPALQYRHFPSSDPNPLDEDWIEGIVIVPLTGAAIVNYPKRHISNGAKKNEATAGTYKPTVRQVKRLRNRAIAEGRLEDGVAPGYLLECMTFNAPPEYFSGNDSDRLRLIAYWLKDADKAGFWSCDRVHTLFGTDPGGFDVSTGQRIADALWEAY